MTSKPHISLVVLAAGKSTRMKQNKLLLPTDGKPMVRRVVEAALASKASEVVVVVGHEHERVREALSGLPCKIVMNQEYEKGQSFSVKRGLDEVKGTADALMILPADVAKVRTEHIDAVLQEFLRNPSAIVVASHGGMTGHPILFSKELFEEISRIDEASFGLKSVTGRHRDLTVRVQVGSNAPLLDVDTPEDYEKATGSQQNA